MPDDNSSLWPSDDDLAMSFVKHILGEALGKDQASLSGQPLSLEILKHAFDVLIQGNPNRYSHKQMVANLEALSYWHKVLSNSDSANKADRDVAEHMAAIADVYKNTPSADAEGMSVVEALRHAGLDNESIPSTSDSTPVTHSSLTSVITATAAVAASLLAARGTRSRLASKL